MLVGGTADEFRHFIYQMENIHDDGSKCPACYEVMLKIVIVTENYPTILQLHVQYLK